MLPPPSSSSPGLVSYCPHLLLQISLPGASSTCLRLSSRRLSCHFTWVEHSLWTPFAPIFYAATSIFLQPVLVCCCPHLLLQISFPGVVELFVGRLLPLWLRGTYWSGCLDHKPQTTLIHLQLCSVLLLPSSSSPGLVSLCPHLLFHISFPGVLWSSSSSEVMLQLIV